jgi:hypothetical protein
MRYATALIEAELDAEREHLSDVRLIFNEQELQPFKDMIRDLRQARNLLVMGDVRWWNMRKRAQLASHVFNSGYGNSLSTNWCKKIQLRA